MKQPVYLVQSDDSRWLEGEREEMRVREPEPELGEAEHSYDSLHVSVTGSRRQRDGDVASAGVDDPLSHDSAVFGHHVLVFIGDDLRVHFAERLCLQINGKGSQFAQQSLTLSESHIT